MKILRGIAEIAKWTGVVGPPLLWLLNVYAPVRDDSQRLDFVIFSLTAAIPEIVCLALTIWVGDYLIRKRRHIRAAFTLPKSLFQSKPVLRRIFAGLAFAVGLVCIVFACIEAESYLRARRRFYLYLFKPAYQQLTERDHLFASVTWQVDRALASGKRLLSFPGREDAPALNRRIRGFTGLNQYGGHLNNTGDVWRQKADADHRVAVDYYCELLSLSPLRATARERLKSLRAGVVSQEPEIRALYQFARNSEDERALSSLRKVQGYLFENSIRNKLEGRLTAPGTNRIAPELKNYILSFAEEEKFVESVRQSWRVKLTEQIIKKSEEFERLASLKPKKWSELGRVLLAYDCPAYARAVLNSLKGLRKLSKLEEKHRIQALLRSGATHRGRIACQEYLLRHPMDDEIRLSLATAMSTEDKPKEVLDLLAPFGLLPKMSAPEIWRLRIEAFSTLEKYSSARLEALNWHQHDKESLRALIALGTCELKLESESRLQAILSIVTALSSGSISLNQADDGERNDVDELLSAVAENIANKASSLSTEQKTEVSFAVQRLVHWLTMEIPNQTDLTGRFIEIGETVHPTNPAFKWVALMNQVYRARAPESKNRTMSLLSLRPEEFPLEYRYRILDAQERLRNLIRTADETMASSVASPAEDPNQDGSSPLEDEEPWRDAQIYEHPREMLFDLGYELYSSPSAHGAMIRSVTQRTSVNIAGEIEVDGVRFFLTDWSLQRFRDGHKDGSYLKPIEPVASSSDQHLALIILPSVQEITFLHGYQVWDGPSKRSRLLKPKEKGSCRIAAYLDTDEGRFYLSDYSLDRHRKGLTKFWIFELKP